jgi:cell division septum initiation protein DivIVA
VSAEELAKQAAERVREVVIAAEQRAEEIVRAAEEEAAQIRQRAESEAREKLERARKALNELAGETPDPPVPGPDPTPPGPDPQPPTPTPDPGPPGPPDPGPQMSSGNSSGSNDAAARLVAMKLAVDGKDREEIEAQLVEKFGSGDHSDLIDDVLARAGK